MLNETIIFMYAGFVAFNATLMYGLHKLHDNSGLYRLSSLAWAFFFVGFMMDGMLYPFGLHHIFGIPFVVFGSYHQALLIQALYGFKIHKKAILIFSTLCWGTAIILHFGFDANFTLTAFFSLLSPSTIYISIGLRMMREFKINRLLEQLFGLALILQGAHLLDYCLLRNKPEHVVFGFSLALILLFVTSLPVPALINEKISKNINNILKKEVESKTKELESAHATAVHTAKLADLGAMAGGVAHEIYTPLGVIMGKSRQIIRKIRREEVATDKLIQELIKIQEAGEHINHVIGSLKSYSRDSGSDPFVPVNLKNLIRKAKDLCIERMRAHGIQFSMPDLDQYAQFEIKGRESQLLQVLVNLLNNAYDAIIEDDEKWIEIKIDINPQKQHICLSVMDSGPGIPADIQATMFQPFVTTKGVGKGTGLGLSIASGILEEHGGQLFVDNSVPNTKFVMQLMLWNDD